MEDKALDEGWERLGKNGLELGKDGDGNDIIRMQLYRNIQAHGEEVSELIFEEPTLKQLEATEDVASGPAEISLLISICCKVPTSSADILRSRDGMRAREALAYFLPGMVRFAG